MTQSDRGGPKRRSGPDEAVKERGKTILIVDDSGMMRLTVSEVVTSLGYDPIEAASGEEATALADYYEPALIMLDIQMPGASGLQSLERMRKNPKLASTPVIMLTVESQRQSIQTAIGLEVFDYLIKPVSVAILRERMTAALEKGD